MQWRYSGTDQRKCQSSASLAFVREIHRWPVHSPHKEPVTREMLPFADVIMGTLRWLRFLWKCLPVGLFHGLNSWSCWAQIYKQRVLIEGMHYGMQVHFIFLCASIPSIRVRKCYSVRCSVYENGIINRIMKRLSAYVTYLYLHMGGGNIRSFARGRNQGQWQVNISTVAVGCNYLPLLLENNPHIPRK